MQIGPLAFAVALLTMLSVSGCAGTGLNLEPRETPAPDTSEPDTSGPDAEGRLVEVELRFDDALRPGDPRLDLAVVTAPRTLAYRTYFESSEGRFETGSYVDDLRPGATGAYVRTISVTSPNGWVTDETTGGLGLWPGSRHYRFHSGQTQYAFLAGPSQGERLVSGRVEDPSRGLEGYGVLSAVVPESTFDSSVGELVAASVPLEGRFEGHFWTYDETRGGLAMMSVRHAGWAEVDGHRTAVVDLVNGLLPEVLEGARPVPGRISDGRPEKGVRFFVDPETRHPRRIETTMTRDEGGRGLFVAIQFDA